MKKDSMPSGSASRLDEEPEWRAGHERRKRDWNAEERRARKERRRSVSNDPDEGGEAASPRGFAS